jgi:hypothetical protein
MTSETKTWQGAILAHFTPKRERMLLVIDPDNLMRDDALLAQVQNNNYDVLELADEVSFRAAFERNYRARWDDGEARHLVVVVHTTNGQRHIPYDLWQKGRRIELSVSALFPNLNAIVVRGLDNAYYADLYPAHQGLAARNEMLRGERSTIEFILRVVFGLDPAGAGDPARWVEFLIHKHYSARELPPALEDYVLHKLLPGVAPAGLRPEFLTDPNAFYAWLSEEWAAYVKRPPGSQRPWGSGIDFADPRLRPLLGYLFAEGLVERAPVPEELSPNHEWLAIGLASVGKGATEVALKESVEQSLYNLKARLARFQAMDETTLPAGKTDLRDWLNLAAEWAEVVYQANNLPAEAYARVQPALAAARETLDDYFWAFVQARYSAVDYYQDNKGPMCLTAVNSWLYQQVGRDERLALVCCDGLALDQWFLLRDYLRAALPGLSFHENRTYALAPGVTPISRQALFAGRPPTAFAETMNRTDQDGERWHAYWVNHDVPARRVAHAAVQVSGQGLDAVRAIAEGKNLCLGVLVNLFDDVMHAVKGMPPEADKRVYYSALRGHLENGRLDELFDLLLKHGYRLFLTADHGNIAGVGSGLAPPKALIETYARRVAIFDKAELAEEYAAKHGLRVFRTKALPPDVHPVYLLGNQLFAAQNATLISHGGLSLEELIVPFVEVVR